MSYLLVSNSLIKREALQSAVKLVATRQVSSDSEAGRWNAEQPVGKNGLICAKLRITSLSQDEMNGFDYIVSIENSIQKRGDVCEDVVNVVMYDVDKDVYYAETGAATQFPLFCWEEVSKYVKTLFALSLPTV